MDLSTIRERREEDVYKSIEAIADDDGFAPDWWKQLKQTVAGTIDEAEVLAADLTAAPTYLMRAVDDLLQITGRTLHAGTGSTQGPIPVIVADRLLRGDWRIEDQLKRAAELTPSLGEILLPDLGGAVAPLVFAAKAYEEGFVQASQDYIRGAVAPLVFAAKAYEEGLIRESPLIALEGELHGEDRLEKIDNGELSVEEVLRQDVEAIPEKSLQTYHSEFQNAARMLKEGDVDGAILALDRMPVSESPTIGLATALEYSSPGRTLEDNLAEWSKKSPLVEAARDTLDFGKEGTFADEYWDRLLGDEDFILPDAPDWVNLAGSMVFNLKAGGAKALGADPEDPDLKRLFEGTKSFQDIAGSEAWNALAAQAEAAAKAGEADTLYPELIGLPLNEMPWNGLGISQPDLALAKEGATDGYGTGEFIRQMEDGASDEELQKILNNTPLSQLPPEVTESWRAANFPDYAAAPVLLSWKQKRDDTYGGMVEKVGKLVQSATTDKVLDNYGSPIAVENTAGVFMRGAGFVSQGLIEAGVLGVEAGLQWATDNSYETARRHVEWADSPFELTGQVFGEWWTRTLAHSSAHPNARPGLFFALGDMYLAGGGNADDDEYYALRTLGLMGDFVLPFEEFAAARLAAPFRAVSRGSALHRAVPGAPLSTKVGFGISPKAFGLSQRLQGRDIPFLDVQTIVSDIATQVVERNLDVGARKADGSLDPTKGLSRTMADQVDDVIRTAGVSPEEMKASLDRASLESSLGYASTVLERLEGANDPLQMRQGQEYKRVRQQVEEAIRQAPDVDEQMPRALVNKSALGRVLDAAFNRKVRQADVTMAHLEIQAARKWAADASQGVATNVDDFFKGIEYRYEPPAPDPSVRGMMPPPPIYKAMGLVEDVEDVGGAPDVLYQKGDRSKPPSVWEKISKAWQDRFIPAVEGTGLPETLTVKTGITDFDEDLYIPAKREPAEAADEIDRIDALRDLVPNPFESDEAWGTFMAHMTGQEDVMKMPPKVREYMLDPGVLAAKIGSATEEQIEAAKDGIRLVEEFGSRYASGEASVTTTASLLFWSMLSRGTETVLQESAYLFLLDAGLEKYIHAAAEGKWTPELSAEYQQWLVDEVKPRSQADLDKANAKARAEFPEKERKRKAEHRLKEKARAEKYRDSVKAKKAKYRADEKSRKALHREKGKARKALHREKEKTRKSAAQQAGKTYRPKEFRPRDYRPRKPPTIKPFERNEFVPKEFVPKKHEVTDPEVLASWDEADMDARARQIGGARQNMGNAAVRFFEVMSEVVKDGPYAGKSTLALVHEWLLDPSLSGTEIRRRFFTTVGTGAQVDIKIFSFMLLTAGRMDVLILDRLQVAHLWDAVGRRDEYKTSSLYDGTTKPGSDPKSFREGQERAWSTSSGLAGALTGTRALALYEAIEDAMIPAIGEAYRMVGRAEDGNVGTFHWETWVIDSAQEVGHPSLQALINVEKGLANPARGVPVRVGKYNRADYGASWMLDGQGDSVYYVENSKGSVYRMTAEEYTPFRGQLTPVVNAALKDGIDVSISNNKERPWHKHKEVDASEFDALVAKYGREVSFEEAVRDDAARGTRLADDPAGAGDAGAGDTGEGRPQRRDGGGPEEGGPGVDDEPLYQRGEGLTRDEFVEKYTNWDPDALVMAGEGAGVESYVSRQVSSGKTTQMDSFDPGLIKEGQPEDLGDGRVMMSGHPGTYTIYEDWGPAEYGSGFGGKRVGRLVVGKSGVEHLALSPELRGKGLAHMLLERAEADGYDVTKADLRTEGFNKTLHDYLTDRGRPAYQRDEGTIKGQFQVDRKTGRYIITLFEDADFTTLWHENGHLARFLLEDQGPSAMKAFTKAFDSEVGADGVRVLTREGEEQAARAFEAYLGTDSAPNGYVLVLFEQLKNALMEFWDRLRGIRRKGQNPEITAMFDQYLGYTRSVEHQARSVARDLRFRHEHNRLTVEPTKRERREAETKKAKAQAKEATRIDLDKDRVLSKLRLTDEVTEVNPHELYMDAVRYVAAETSKRIASEKTIVLTRNSVVPVTRLKAVERAVKEKLAPLFDSAEQSVGGPFGSRRWRKRMEEAGAELDGDKIKLTQAAQDRLRALANQLVHDPVIRQKLNPDWLKPEEDVSTISIRDFNSLVEGVIDSEAGFGTARTRYAQDIPVGAIEAAHNAFKNGYKAMFAGAKEPGSLVNSVRDLVKTRRSLETEEGALVNPPVQEAMDRASRALGDIPGWFRRIGKQARRTRFGWRSRTDIMDMLHHDLHEQLALPYEPDFLEFLYKLQNDVFRGGAGFEVLRENLGEISRALSYRRRHSQPPIELLMMEYIETIGRRADQEQLSWVDDLDAPPEFKLTDTEMEMLQDAASVLEDAVRQRINAAEQRADVIFKCFSGIKKDVALEPDQVRALYRAFHDGDWDEITDIMVKRGLATGTKVDEIPKFSRDAALTQAIVRMRAMQILDDMWKELAEVGVNLKFSEWLPSGKDAPYGADIALFKERVLEHLKEISEWQDWVVYAEEVPGAPEVIAGPRRGGVEAEDVGTRKEQERILTKRGDIERVPHLKEDTKVIGYTAIDVAAREVAMDLYQQTGFKTSQMDWVEASLPDGSTALMPEIMKNELDKALDRATGPLGTAYDKGLVPGDSSSDVRTHKVKARLLTGKAVDSMMRLIPNMPHHIRMGITTGFFWTVNAAYYVSSSIGAALQMYQAVGGIRSMASTFGEPMMTASVVAGLFGDGVRVPYSKPIVDRFGRIYTAGELIRLSTAEGLNTSALKTETATSLAQDINKMTAHAANPLRAWWFSNKLLVESATALDNYFRVGVFIDQLKSGKAPNQAAEVARKAMLDYNDLTDAEKAVARNVVMFYSYIRKNIDLTWDTMLKNPSRILGQVRVVRGLKKEFFKDEPEIVDNEWTQMKLPVYFANMAMNDWRYSGIMFTPPPLPYQDSFGLLFELYDTATQLAESFVGTGTTRARDAAISKLSARLTPWVQYPLVALTGFEPFKGRQLQDVTVPNSFIAIDESMNNGSMRRFFGARPVPIDYRERDRAASPHQGFEWKITSKEGQLKWWAFKSLWPYPISPSLLDEKGEWRLGADVHPPGTRMLDTVQAGDRVGITDHVVKAARLYAGGGDPEGWQSTIETHRLPFTRVGEDEDGNAIYDTEAHRPWLSPWMEALALAGVKPTRTRSVEYAAQQAQQDLVRAAEEKVGE